MFTRTSLGRRLRGRCTSPRLLARASGSGWVCVVTRTFVLPSSMRSSLRACGRPRVVRCAFCAEPAAVCTQDSMNAVIVIVCPGEQLYGQARATWYARARGPHFPGSDASARGLDGMSRAAARPIKRTADCADYADEFKC